MIKHLYKITWLLASLAFTVMIFIPLTPVYATSNTTTALYAATVRIVNNGTATAYNVTVPFSLNTTNLINNYVLANNCTNSALQTGSGGDAAYNPAVASNTTWALFAPTVPVGSIDYVLYLGGPSNMGGKIRYIPGTTGLFTVDNASLELGNNFSVQTSGYFDTSVNGVGFLKPNAFAITTKPGYIEGHILSTSSIPGSGSTVWGSMTNIVKRLGIPATSFTGIISTVIVDLKKTNTPTGDVTITVRNQADDSILGTLATFDASTLSGSFVEYRYYGAFYVPSATNIYVLVEYYSGNATYTVDVGTSGSVGSSVSYTTSYSSGTAQPIYVGYSALNRTASKEATAGDHTARIYADTSNLSIQVDGGTPASTALNTARVPNNANNLTTLLPSGMPYALNQTISVNGTLVQNISWQNAAIWTDASGNGNQAIPSFASTSSNASVSASIVTFSAIAQPIATNWTGISTYTNYIGPVPATPTGMYENTTATFPGADLPDDIEAGTGGLVPATMFWFIFPVVLILAASMALHGATKSLVAQAGVVWIAVLFVGLLHIWSLWVLVPITFEFSAICLAGKVYGY